jgi:hypothetical protein
MPAAKYDLVIEQGTDYIKSFNLKNPDNSIKDLNGFTAKMQIRQYKFDAEAKYEASTANGKILIAVNSGTVQLRFPNQDTANFDFNKGVYDIELTDQSGIITRLMEGEVIISKEVTR